MRKQILIAAVFLNLLLSPFNLLQFTLPAGNREAKNTGGKKGTAVIITGAAARIPQEAALLEQLYNTGELNDVGMITGVSSGALNAVVLNAIMDGRFTWERYRNILFAISNDRVFIRNGKKLPVDTSPLRELIERIVNDSLGYFKIGDLPYPSALSATNLEIVPLKERTFRFSNRNINSESNPDFNLVDILMASTAIPVVFPSVRLDYPDFNHPISYIDGAVGDDNIPYKAVMMFEQLSGTEFEKLIIVSRKSHPDSDIGSELRMMGLKDTRLMEKLTTSLQRYTEEEFIKKLKQMQKNYPELASRTYVYVPDFSKNYSMLNFDNLKDQYVESAAWAVSHKPVLLERFLAEKESHQ